MKFLDYQELSKRTMPMNYGEVNDIPLYGDREKCNYAMGLTGEAGEVVDLMKKWIHHGHSEDLAELTKELGDVLHYLSGIATMYGLSLENVATENIVKLQKRYPEGFSQERSVQRDA